MKVLANWKANKYIPTKIAIEIEKHIKMQEKKEIQHTTAVSSSLKKRSLENSQVASNTAETLEERQSTFSSNITSEGIKRIAVDPRLRAINIPSNDISASKQSLTNVQPIVNQKRKTYPDVNMTYEQIQR